VLRNILVPLDGSAFGEHALPLAMALARRAGAELQLVHVHQVIPPATLAGVTVMGAVESAAREQEQAYLRRLADKVATQAQVPVKWFLLEGETTEALQRHMESAGADLMVLATHGRGPLGRFWLGSVADEVMRHLNGPVILVRPEEEAVDLSRMPPLDHLLVPLDGTPLAEQILEQAVPLAQLLKARVMLARVVRPVLRPDYLPEGTTIGGLDHTTLEEVRRHQVQLEEEARAYLEQVAGRLRDVGLTVEVRVMVGEQPAVRLLDEAEAARTRMIALTTHGRSGLRRLFLGSVADKLVRGAQVPVLVRRPREV
jgi:nucleotide-binding universal stress UspA family protein